MRSSAFALAFVASAQAFRVFDNTAYTNVSIGYGSTPINWIPNYECKPLVQDGDLPTAATWQAIVRSWLVYPGYPFVLDCEDLYMDDASTAADNLDRLKALQTWTADVLPANTIIGWYGILGNTPSSLYGLYRELIANHTPHAYFPSAYTFTSSYDTWTSSLATKLSQAEKIDSSIPVIPYTWPQYHDNYTFLPVDLWKRELSHMQSLGKSSKIAGFIVWGGKNHAVCDDACQETAGQKPWLEATRRFLSSLYGIYSRTHTPGGQLFSEL